MFCNWLCYSESIQDTFAVKKIYEKKKHFKIWNPVLSPIYLKQLKLDCFLLVLPAYFFPPFLFLPAYIMLFELNLCLYIYIYK